MLLRGMLLLLSFLQAVFDEAIKQGMAHKTQRITPKPKKKACAIL